MAPSQRISPCPAVRWSARFAWTAQRRYVSHLSYHPRSNPLFTTVSSRVLIVWYRRKCGSDQRRVTADEESQSSSPNALSGRRLANQQLVYVLVRALPIRLALKLRSIRPALLIRPTEIRCCTRCTRTAGTRCQNCAIPPSIASPKQTRPRRTANVPDPPAPRSARQNSNLDSIDATPPDLPPKRQQRFSMGDSMFT